MTHQQRFSLVIVIEILQKIYRLCLREQKNLREGTFLRQYGENSYSVQTSII